MLPNPLLQSDAYARALRALGTEVRIDVIGDPNGVVAGRCLIQTRHVPLLGRVNLISRGPVLAAGQDDGSYLRDLSLTGPVLINSPQARKPPGCLRIIAPQAIALRPITCPDRMRAELHQNWRNALVRAERSGLKIRRQTYDPVRDNWLIAADRAQQDRRRYRNLPTRFLDTYARATPGAAQVVTAFDRDSPLAAMLILCHPPWATYHLGHTTGAGRERCAHHLILWHILTWLWESGCTMLDLGRLTGPPGLDRFKLRSGAQSQHLGGTWLRLPSVLRTGFPRRGPPKLW